MKNVFVNTIVFVKDLNISKDFYSNILGMDILKEYGTIVFYENQLVLHQTESIIETVYKKRKSSVFNKQGHDNLLLYFETDDLLSFYNQISKKVRIIHGIEEQSWGQKVFRFHDPDSHIIEFGEPYHSKVLLS
jgi:catechol 2,3-dioxygenase-like lactoylglutathione lyase family enzyme